MAFITMCAVFVAIIQLTILFNVKVKYQMLKYASLIFMECLPFGYILYLWIKKPTVAYLGWEFEAVLCLWGAGGILAGYLLAWGIYSILGKLNS